MREVLMITAMMVLTFTPRYLPFALAGRIDFPPLVRRALEFVPIAVLTAIVTQATFYRDSVLSLTVSNHYLIAALCAFVTALLTRHLLLTIVLGLMSYGLSMGLGLGA